MSWSHVIFDLDGTLLDTLADLHASVCYALAAHGLPGRSIDETRASVGNGARRLIERSVPDGSPDALVDEVLASFRTHYAAHCEDATAPYPGIDVLLAGLEARSIPCAIISNKPDGAVRTLAERWFPQAAGHSRGEREDVARKPAPDALLQVMGEMGADPADVVYVGDSEVDLAFAGNAGVECIACTWGFRGEAALVEAGATIIAHTPEELLELIVS